MVRLVSNGRVVGWLHAFDKGAVVASLRDEDALLAFVLFADQPIARGFWDGGIAHVTALDEGSHDICELYTLSVAGFKEAKRWGHPPLRALPVMVVVRANRRDWRVG